MKLGIKKIAYREYGSFDEWSNVPIVHLSGTLSEECKTVDEGMLSTVKVMAQIRRPREEVDVLMGTLINPFKRYQYKVLAMDGTCYIIGDGNHRPVFSYNRDVGSLNVSGYDIAIDYVSTVALKAER